MLDSGLRIQDTGYWRCKVVSSGLKGTKLENTEALTIHKGTELCFLAYSSRSGACAMRRRVASMISVVWAETV